MKTRIGHLLPGDIIVDRSIPTHTRTHLVQTVSPTPDGEDLVVSAVALDGALRGLPYHLAPAPGDGQQGVQSELTLERVPPPACSRDETVEILHPLNKKTT